MRGMSLLPRRGSEGHYFLILARCHRDGRGRSLPRAREGYLARGSARGSALSPEKLECVFAPLYIPSNSCVYEPVGRRLSHSYHAALAQATPKGQSGPAREINSQGAKHDTVLS